MNPMEHVRREVDGRRGGTMEQEIRVDQVWESRDPREPGRTVTVEEVNESFAVVRSVRRSRLRVENLRRYYRLRKDAS
jgi:hypothetical protein